MTHVLVSTLKQTQKNLLLPFCYKFLLAWTEQTSIFQYFGNLTVNSFQLYYKIISIVLFQIVFI
jgi:hypothetical protein